MMLRIALLVSYRNTELIRRFGTLQNKIPGLLLFLSGEEKALHPALPKIILSELAQQIENSNPEKMLAMGIAKFLDEQRRRELEKTELMSLVESAKNLSHLQLLSRPESYQIEIPKWHEFRDRENKRNRRRGQGVLPNNYR